MKNKKALAMAVWAAVASIGFVMTASAAEETMNTEVAPVVVEGQQDVLPGGMVADNARMGIMGNKDIMEIPYSEMSMTSKAIETFDNPSMPLANVLINNPSIRMSSTTTMYSDFSMRGINMNGNHMMTNGVPSLYSQFTAPPSHIVERVDITSGPNAAVNGVSMSNNGTNSGATPAPGTINVITKRATDTPVTRYTQSFSGRGNWGETVDVGRRFGKNNEWGVRVNAQIVKGETSLPNAKTDDKNIFIDVDHRGEKSYTNLFAGHFHQRIDGGQRWFTYKPDSKITSGKLPTAPNSKNYYDFPGTRKFMYGYIATINHDQKMNDNWSWFVDAGLSRRSGSKDNQGANLKFNEVGSFEGLGNALNQQNEEAKNAYARLGIKGQVKTGEVKHNLALAVDRSWARYWNKSGSNNPKEEVILGTIYGNANFKPFNLPYAGNGTPQWEETNVGVTIGDTMDIGKVSLMLAASRKHENLQSFNGTKNIKNDNWLPSYGITYRPTEQVAMYFGHTECFSRGLVVPNSGNSNKKYTNAGEIMEPVKSKQNELGVKYMNGGTLQTLSYFDIDEPNRYDIDASKNTLTKVDNGKNRYKGVEYTINGQIAKKWTLTGGLMWLNAQREKTKNGTKDGLFVTGASKWSSVLGFEYKPEEKWGIVGRATMMGKAFIENTNSAGKYEIPAYVTYDLGVNYKTKLGSVPVRMSAMCHNVTNKDYWMGRGGSSTFGLSIPRTFMVSATFDI